MSQDKLAFLLSQSHIYYTNQPHKSFSIALFKVFIFLLIRFIVSTHRNLGEKDRVEIQDHRVGLRERSLFVLGEIVYNYSLKRVGFDLCVF